MLRLICVSALPGLLAVAPTSSKTVPEPDLQLLVGNYNFAEQGVALDDSLNSHSPAVQFGASVR